MIATRSLAQIAVVRAADERPAHARRGRVRPGRRAAGRARADRLPRRARGSSSDPQDETRVENLAELESVAREFETDQPEGTLADFLERVSLVADSDEIPDAEEHGGVVTLMTLHTAKGLEFPVVFLTGLEDGVFPHMRSLGDTRELEEERRLAYVGITRARRAALRLARDRALGLGRAVVQPAEPLPRGAPRRARALEPRGPGRPGDGDRSSAPRARVRRGAAPRSPPRRTRPGARSPGNREVVSLSAGDRVTHDKFGLGTVVSTQRHRREGRGDDRLRRRGHQAPAAALRPGREAVAHGPPSAPSVLSATGRPRARTGRAGRAGPRSGRDGPARHTSGCVARRARHRAAGAARDRRGAGGEGVPLVVEVRQRRADLVHHAAVDRQRHVPDPADEDVAGRAGPGARSSPRCLGTIIWSRSLHTATNRVRQPGAGSASSAHDVARPGAAGARAGAAARTPAACPRAGCRA